MKKQSLSMYRKTSFWVGLFLLLAVLTQDYLWITWPQATGLGGFPIWLAWFVLIHLIFVIAFFFFAKYYWK